MVEMGFHNENKKFFDNYGIAEESGIPKKKIALVLQNEFKENPNAQSIFMLCSNLLARLFVNIDFIIPNNTTLCNILEDGTKSMNEQILNNVQAIFSKGHFTCYPNIPDKITYDGVLIVGDNNLGILDSIFVLSDGWNVYVNNRDAKSEYHNHIGACAAACFGAAEVFKLVVKPNGCKSNNMVFSLLDFTTDESKENPILPNNIDIGEVALIGAGAIGSAIIYALNYLPNVRGKLYIIDADKYTNTNLNRYIIADETTIGKYKVDVVTNILKKHSELDVIKCIKVYDDFKKDNIKVDTFITAVDKKITRFNIQSDIPRLVIDAATTDSLIDLARVDFGTDGACLGCLYLPEPKDDLVYFYISEHTGLNKERVKYLFNRSEGVNADDIKIISKKMNKNLDHYIGSPIESIYNHEYCGSGKIDSSSNEDEVIIAPVSFISALAGVLATCELIKDRYLPEYKVKNHYLIDILKEPNSKLHNFKVKNGKCPYCNDEVFLDVYKSKWLE